jgi:hypothetical protein
MTRQEKARRWERRANRKTCISKNNPDLQNRQSPWAKVPAYDPRQHCRPLDRNERARILALAEALERRTKPAGGRNAVLGFVLKALVCGFLRRSDGMCCPSVKAIQKATGLARSTVCEALNRLEAAGIVQRVRRLVRGVVDFGGLARLTTVQTSKLYAFFTPSPLAHLLPVRSRRRNPVARLVSALAKSFGPFEKLNKFSPRAAF